MPNIEIPFIGGAYTARSKNLNAQVCQNLYLEIDQTGAKNIIALVGCPGMKSYKTVADGEVRALFEFGGSLHGVIGNSLYNINTVAQVDTIGTSTGWADITNDGIYVGIFDSTGGWYFDGATMLDLSLPVTPSGATYQDGYHIISRANSDQIFICTQDDITTWGATDYATAEGSGDILVSPVSVQRQLWLIGTESTEIWYNAGTTFPFARNPGGYLNIGCNSKRSIASLLDELMFLDNHNRVVRKQGLLLAPVSTYQIEYLISTLTKTSDSIGFMYHQEGHTFYELTFPTDNKTICYDLTTGFWHTRASGNPDIRSFANCAISYDDKVLVGHYGNGDIYEYDLATYTDAGEVKRAIRASQPINNNGQILFFHSFQVDMETGVGNAAVSDPQAMLKWSDDGGHTWSQEHWKTLGAIGQYESRAKWNRLGSSRNRVFHLEITDAVKRNIINAYLDGAVGNA